MLIDSDKAPFEFRILISFSDVVTRIAPEAAVEISNVSIEPVAVTSSDLSFVTNWLICSR